jgi:hypothetical protein
MSRDWDDEKASARIVNLVHGPANTHETLKRGARVGAVSRTCLNIKNHKLIFFATEDAEGIWAAFWARKRYLRENG